MTPFDAVLFVIIMAVIISLAFVRHYKKNKRKECLFSYISWIYNKAKPEDFNLYTFLYSLQIKEWYNDKVCLLDRDNEQEKIDVKEILDAYTNNMLNSYFKGFYYTDDKYYKFTEESHFLFSLFDFLYNICNDKHPMTIYSKLYDKVYSNESITSFGRTYYKLYYIATKYCEKNHYTKDYPTALSSERIKQYLQ